MIKLFTKFRERKTLIIFCFDDILKIKDNNN